MGSLVFDACCVLECACLPPPGLSSLLSEVAGHVHTLSCWNTELVPGVLGPPSPYLETDVLWWRGQALPSGPSPPVLIWHPRSRVYSPSFRVYSPSSSKEPACRDRSPCDYPSPHLPWERVFPLGEASLSVGDEEMVHWGFFFFFQPAEKVLCVCWINFVIFQVASFFSLNFNCPNYQLTSGGLIWETCIFVTLYQSS